MELVDNKTVILTSTTKTVRVGRLSMRDTFVEMLSKYGFAQGFQLLGIAWREKHRARRARTHESGYDMIWF